MAGMLYKWDEEKDKLNQKKHNIPLDACGYFGPTFFTSLRRIRYHACTSRQNVFP